MAALDGRDEGSREGFANGRLTETSVRAPPMELPPDCDSQWGAGPGTPMFRNT